MVVLGQAGDADEARRLMVRYLDQEAAERALGATRAWWDGLLT
jgi:hypothetical protein